MLENECLTVFLLGLRSFYSAFPRFPQTASYFAITLFLPKSTNTEAEGDWIAISMGAVRPVSNQTYRLLLLRRYWFSAQTLSMIAQGQCAGKHHSAYETTLTHQRFISPFNIWKQRHKQKREALTINQHSH